MRIKATIPLSDARVELAPAWSSAMRVPGEQPRLVIGPLDNTVWSGAFSADGRLLATLGRDGIHIWDATSGKPIAKLDDPLSNTRGPLVRRMRGPRGEPSPHIAFFDSGRRLAVIESRGVRVWDTLRRTRLRTIAGEPVAWTRDLRRIVINPSEGFSGPIAIDPASDAVPTQLPFSKAHDMNEDGTRILGTRFANAASPKTRLIVCDGAGAAVATVAEGTRSESAAFSANGTLVAIGDGDGTIYDVRTRRIVARVPRLVPRQTSTLEFADDNPGNLATPREFSSDGRLLFLRGDGPDSPWAFVAVSTGRVVLRGDGRPPSRYVLKGTMLRAQVCGENQCREHSIDLGTLKEAAADPSEFPTIAAARHASGLALFPSTATAPARVEGAPGSTAHELASLVRPMFLAQPTASSRVFLAEAAREDTASRYVTVLDLPSGQTLFEQTVAPPFGDSIGAISRAGDWVAIGSAVYPVGLTDAAAVETYPGRDARAIGPNRSWVLTPDAMYWREGTKYREVKGPPLDPKRSGSSFVATPDGSLVATSVSVASQRRIQTSHGPLLRTEVDSSVTLWSGRTGTEVGHATFAKRAVPPLWPDLVFALETGAAKEAAALVNGASASRFDAPIEVPVVDAMSSRLLSLNGEVFEASGKLAAAIKTDGSLTGATWLEERDFAAITQNGTLRLWDLKEHREALQIVCFRKGHWIAIDREGRFDTNDVEHLGDLSWTKAGEPMTLLPIESLLRDYFHPGLVKRVLARLPLDPVPDLAKLNVVSPTVSIEEVTQAPSGKLSVRVRVRDAIAKAGDGIVRAADPRDVRLFRDGRLVGRQPESLGGSADVVFDGIDVPHGSTMVELAAYAFNADGVKSATATKSFSPAPATPAHRPRAYVVTVGVNAYDAPGLDLDYAVADATVLADRLSAGLARHHDVRTVRLLGTTASTTGGSREALISVLRKLAGRGDDASLEIFGLRGLDTVTPDDVVVLTFAGHGVTSADGSFHMLFADFAGSDQEVRGAPGTLDDETLAKEMAAIDAGEITLVVDACQSGAAVDKDGFKPGPLGARGFGQMAYDKRIRVLAASQSDDVALEASSVGHGLLTYALAIEGLDRGAADFRPKDGAITLSEWLSWGAARVPALADALANGEPGSRGIKVVRLARPKRASQEPRLFDDRLHPSTIEVGRRR